MNSLIHRILLLLALPIVGGYVLADDQLNYLRTLKNRNPTQDAQEAIKSSNLKFLAVGGYALSVPGVDTKNCLVDRELTELIKGTGDVWENTEHMELQKIAEEYAFKFNQIMKTEFQRKNIKYKCTWENENSAKPE
jgi:hypothetical protein